jgi:serine/threonine protein kinase
VGKLLGTVDYVAPEQAENAQTADIRADIYSLGCSLYYLLTGGPPFPGADAVAAISARVLGRAPSVRQSRPEVSPGLDLVLAKMMARQPEHRYQTPGEVAKALEPHTAKEGQARSKPTPIPETPAARAAQPQAARSLGFQASEPPQPEGQPQQPEPVPAEPRPRPALVPIDPPKDNFCRARPPVLSILVSLLLGLSCLPVALASGSPWLGVVLALPGMALGFYAVAVCLFAGARGLVFAIPGPALSAPAFVALLLFADGRLSRPDRTGSAASVG